MCSGRDHRRGKGPGRKILLHSCSLDRLINRSVIATALHRAPSFKISIFTYVSLDKCPRRRCAGPIGFLTLAALPVWYPRCVDHGGRYRVESGLFPYSRERHGIFRYQPVGS